MKKLFIFGICIFFMVSHGRCQITTAAGNLIFYDTLDFSQQDSWITINNPDSNVWEYGLPSKPFFNSAHNGNKAIMTDTANFYGSNCNDFFQIVFPCISIYGEGILSFYHKFDSDTLTDGGIIEISYDEGNSWINIKEDTFHIMTNFIGIYEDTVMGGEFGFSGRSNDWQYVELYWWWTALTKSDATYLECPLLRFRFLSDTGQTNKEGWMIDDIVFRGYLPTGHVNDVAQTRVILYPNPAQNTIIISFKHEQPENLIFKIYELSGKMIQEQSIKNGQIEISGLKQGMYIYGIFRDEKRLEGGKFIKE